MFFKKVRIKVCFILLFNLFYCLCNITYADVLETKLSRDRITLGETITVSFSFNNTSADTSPDFSPLGKDFRILGTNYGTAINVINGITKTKTFWYVTLEPTQAGELVIPAISFGNVKSLPQKLIVEEEKAFNPSSHANASAFVQAELSTTTPYIQSQVLYTFKLFYRSQLETPRLEPPHVKDALLVQIDDGKFYQTTLKGEQFFVFEKNFAFFPQKSGELKISPTYLRALTFDTDPGLTAFSLTTAKPIRLATKSLTLDVQKIPETFQGKTWLPAKNISIEQSWSVDPSQWEVGNPVTRTITIEAEGLRADQIPDLTIENISNINIYTDPPQRSNSIQGTTVVGKLQQKINYIPNTAQSITIPPIQLHWWNTQSNKSALAELKAFTVDVQNKMGHANDAAATIPSQRLPLTTATNINQDKGKYNQLSPFYLSIWFWVAMNLLLIWIITLGLFWKTRFRKKVQINKIVTKDNPTDNLAWQEKDFVQACEKGDAVLAQKLILRWGETRWEDPPRNLAKLRDNISDDSFKAALTNLEMAMYANKNLPWNGLDLLQAYQRLRKNKKFKFSNKIPTTGKNSQDPLPPLNP